MLPVLWPAGRRRLSSAAWRTLCLLTTRSHLSFITLRSICDGVLGLDLPGMLKSSQPPDQLALESNLHLSCLWARREAQRLVTLRGAAGAVTAAGTYARADDGAAGAGGVGNVSGGPGGAGGPGGGLLDLGGSLDLGGVPVSGPAADAAGFLHTATNAAVVNMVISSLGALAQRPRFALPASFLKNECSGGCLAEVSISCLLSRLELAVDIESMHALSLALATFGHEVRLGPRPQREPMLSGDHCSQGPEYAF